MIPGMQFASFRLTILAFAILAQAYLFISIRQLIRSSSRSESFKSRLIGLVGMVMALLFVMNGCILFMPVPWIDPPLIAQIALFYVPAVWSLGSVFSAPLLALIQLSGRFARRALRPFRGQIDQPVPVNPGRRHFLQAGAGAIAAAPLVLVGYGAAYTRRPYDFRELTLPFGCPLRVVQVTDIHAGPYMTRTEVRRYSEKVIALKPDLFVLTGDFISNSIAFLPGCLEEMARVNTPYGIFATLGNHENWHGRLKDLRTIFGQHGIALLRNRHRVIQTEHGPFAVAGVDDIRTGHPDLEAALRGLDPSIPTLLLSHRPEIFPKAATRGIPLTLAGHYHGGQIKLSLPGGDISLAHLRTPYPEGLYRINNAHLYVSRGIGTTFTPVRLNAPPEITLLNLT